MLRAGLVSLDALTRVRRRNVRSGEGDVDGGRVEDGGAVDKDHLDHEAAKGPGVRPEDDAAGVADGVEEAADDHEGHEAVAAPSDAEIYVDSQGEGEEHGEGDVDGQAGSVLIGRPPDRAEVEGAVGPWAECGEHARVDIAAVVKPMQVLRGDARLQCRFCVHGAWWEGLLCRCLGSLAVRCGRRENKMSSLMNESIREDRENPLYLSYWTDENYAASHCREAE